MRVALVACYEPSATIVDTEAYDVMTAPDSHTNVEQGRWGVAMRCRQIILGACFALLSSSVSAQTFGDFLQAITRDVVQSKPVARRQAQEAADRWLVVASRENAQEAVHFAQTFTTTLGDVSVVQTTNGRFAIVAGFLGHAKAKANTEALKAIRLIPQDSFLTTGERFRVVVWNSGSGLNTEIVQRQAVRRSVSRLQSALARLGLYSGAVDGAVGPATSEAFDTFVQRFAPQVWEGLDEGALASIEQVAIDGFRSDQERLDARQKGFQDAADMSKAFAAGFSTNTDYAEATRFGFLSKEEFDQFRLSGFGTKSEFDDAKQKGFTEKTAYDAHQQQALAALEQRAREMLDDAEQFLRINPQTANIVELASAAAALKGALGVQGVAEVSKRLDELSRGLSSVSGFDAFSKARADERLADKQKKIVALRERLEQQRNAIRLWMAQNLMHQATADLADEMIAVENAVASGDLEALSKSADSLSDLLHRWGLMGDIDRLINSGGSATTAVSEKPEYTITQTPHNTFLLNGNGDDWVALYNASSSAPSIIRNLLGDYVFEKRSAKICMLPLSQDPSLTRAISRELRQFEAERVDFGRTKCSPDALLLYDIILLNRRDFLKSELSFAVRVLNLLDARELREFPGLPHAKLHALQIAEGEARASIASEIDTGARNGFGALMLDEGKPRLCAVVAEDAVGHAELIEEVSDFIQSEGRKRPETQFSNAEEAYRAIQREECSAVYADAAQLKLISSALARDGRTFTYVPLWFDSETILTLTEQEQQERKRHTEELEAKRIAAEEERRILAEKEARQKEEAAERERVLQDRHGAEARALQERLSTGLQQLTTPGASKVDRSQIVDFLEQATLLFPNFVTWNSKLPDELWTAKALNTEIVDYGTGVWKDRHLQQIALRVEVMLESAARGEKRTECFQLGVLVDDEFRSYRDSLEVRCSASDAENLKTWTTAHKFESRWRAN